MVGREDVRDAVPVPEDFAAGRGRFLGVWRPAPGFDAAVSRRGARAFL